MTSGLTTPFFDTGIYSLIMCYYPTEQIWSLVTICVWLETFALQILEALLLFYELD